MKIMVDQSKCQTMGICVRELPEVFRFQEGSKKAMVTLEKIPPSLQQKCRAIVRKCPNNAISIEE